ncbi:hypothetical protein EXS72_00325 [Candidatus Pacearchaeota archaeon]|nr:hypothetical protein [Candidatus Pacearchaeota archaeon]
MDRTDLLLEQQPFNLEKKEKDKYFVPAITEAINFHYNHSIEFRKICDSKGWNNTFNSDIEKLPFISVNLFKKMKLISVKDEDIVTVVKSSATTGNNPSMIYLDELTRKRQVKCLNSIVSSFIGNQRINLIVFDTENTIKSNEHSLSSRGSAIRGMLPFAKSVTFILDDDLHLKTRALEEILIKLKGQPVCFFGFTWLLYKIVKDISPINFPESVILHIGGWKKLSDISVSKDVFNKTVSSSLASVKIYDIYGMTEQLGTVYIDCEQGYKHVPNYSDVIMRDVGTLESTSEGFIQLISPVPHSYPGISLLTDDIGKIIGEDDCLCGRKGKYFIFKERAKNAELKGCGDTLK